MMSSAATLAKVSRSQEPFTFVDAYEFRRLVISNRRLERADLPLRQLKGLKDLATGEHFVTPEEDLFR